ncbi:DUF2169 family type VI secretion system accessory protein [Pseudomonas indica]|uniref:DUF2169 family type VI secretion system accessory protein n=1 Tax=Pseudomonas indica TaxID=137658 RepID=UPI000BC73C7E|nr:DUF2169 domain-containing protein [Pseudomonas indica]PAU64856.1 hypothetical protein BZL42_01165 [Pseudomonas indica]
MFIENLSPYVAGWNVGFLSDGREVAVVVVKGTFLLSPNDARGSQRSDIQQPLLEADVFGQDPARDAPIHENDFVPFKPRCDILLRAQAHAPDGRPVTRLDVGFLVGNCRKALTVVGQREWRNGLLRASASEPVPFVVQDISYDRAFGGTDIDPADPNRIELYRENPAGTGYCRFKQNLDGMPLPTTEELGHPVTRPTGRYRPMAFGPIGRHWLPRCGYAGTYDAKWQEERMPFLPDDFDPRYYQTAPPDQQIPYPQGGEPIVLLHLTPEGRLQSQLPRETLYVRFVRKRGPVTELRAQLDTVLIEPEDNRLCLTWRAACPLDRDAFELSEMVVEPESARTAGLLRARQSGKRYYPNLEALIRSRKGGWL